MRIYHIGWKTHIYVQAPRELYIRASKTLSFPLSQGFFSRWPNLSSPAHLILSVVFSPPFPLYIYIYIYHRYGPSPFRLADALPLLIPFFGASGIRLGGKRATDRPGKRARKQSGIEPEAALKAGSIRRDMSQVRGREGEERKGKKGVERLVVIAVYVCVCVRGY